MRFYFDQYINLRPAKLLRGVESPLKGKKPHDINIYMIRENSEDFYIGLGARFTGNKSSETMELKRKLYKARFKVDVDVEPAGDFAYQIGVVTEKASERVLRYGFELAEKKKMTRVTVVHKANVLTKVYGLWIEKAEQVAKDYPGIALDFAIADATTMWLVRRPEHFQVIVAPNLFGDILSDLAAATVGGLGFAPGGNINPDRKAGVSMFEPISGSAPKYKASTRPTRSPRSLPGSSCWSIWAKTARPSWLNRRPRTSWRPERSAPLTLAASRRAATWATPSQSVCSSLSHKRRIASTASRGSSSQSHRSSPRAAGIRCRSRKGEFH